MKHFNRKLSLELASLVLVALMLTVGGLGWRLSRGPVGLDFLRAVVESKFHRQTGLHLALDHITFGIASWQAPVVFTIDNARIARDDGSQVATIATLTAALARRPLFDGRLHPIDVEIARPMLFVSQMTLPPPVVTQPETAEPRPLAQRIEAVLGQLAHPAPGSPFADWDRAVITDGAVQSDGHALLDGLEATLERTAVGFKGQAHSDNGVLAAIEVNRGQKGSIAFHSPALPLSILAQIPALSFLASDSVPVELTLAATLNDAAIVDGRLDAAIGKGNIVDAHLPAVLAVIDGRIEAFYQASPERIILRRCELTLDGPRLAAEGHADIKGGMVTVESTVTVSAMKLDDLKNYWPVDAVPGGRQWVTANLSAGTIESASLHLTGTMPQAAPGAFSVGAMGGSMQVDGVKVHYFGQLPDVQQAAATIDYDRDSMTVRMIAGHAGAVAVKGGTIVIDGFNLPEQTIAIDLDLGGPVSAALALIDRPPLGYTKKLQIVPGTVGGTADTHLHMAFPLLDAVGLDQLGVVVQSALHDVSIPAIVAHRDINALNGTLNVDMNGMELAGAGQLIDIPATFDYKQSFATGGGSSANFSGMADEKQRAELGLDFPDRLKGPIGIAGTYAEQGSKASADIALDLTPALFAIDEIGYTKPAGEKGSAKFTLALRGGAIVAIDPLTVEAPAFLATGSAAFADNKLTTLSLSQLRADESDMHVTVAPLETGGSKIVVAGSEFDARRFLHKRRGTPESAQPEPDAVPLVIVINLAKVRMADNQTLTDVNGELELLGRKWRSANFSANANGSNVFLSYLPDSTDSNPSYTLHAGAQDAGAAFAGFALTDSIKGGVLVIEGGKAAATPEAPAPSLAATLTLTGFRLTHAPILARLLNLLSVTGFEKAVVSSDIKFSAFTAKFEIDDQELRISNGRLTGAALGMTIAGTVNRDAGALNLYGTAVPAAGANRILNAIPLLGPLLTGGDGQGIFAATYSVTGRYENPDVSVNPLSVFAPGVLRDLLFTPSDPDMDGDK